MQTTSELAPYENPPIEDRVRALLCADGKGQVQLEDGADLAAAWAAIAEQPAILEAFVPFACEVSVIVARGLDGATAAYVPVENRHEAGILRETIAPARVAQPVADQAAAERADTLPFDEFLEQYFAQGL